MTHQMYLMDSIGIRVNAALHEHMTVLLSTQHGCSHRRLHIAWALLVRLSM